MYPLDVKAEKACICEINVIALIIGAGSSALVVSSLLFCKI